MSDLRLVQLQNWLQTKIPSFSMTPITNDASFRRYFRVNVQNYSFIAMDAPPEKENCLPFVAVATALKKQGIYVPEIVYHNLAEGFLLLSDFGDDLYLNLLNTENADSLYSSAIETLVRLQHCPSVSDWQCPKFDEAFILKELSLFPKWFLEEHLNILPTPALEKLIQTTFQNITQKITSQPYLFVHRDYHSRNLLWHEEKTGVLDFQDAVWGPVTYDAVSLFRDCYIDWPEKNIKHWLSTFHDGIHENKSLKKISFEQLWEWFDWTSIERHLRILGTFSRLRYRNQKPQYLEKYFERIFNYLTETMGRYTELADFLHFFRNSSH